MCILSESNHKCSSHTVADPFMHACAWHGTNDPRLERTDTASSCIDLHPWTTKGAGTTQFSSFKVEAYAFENTHLAEPQRGEGEE